MRAREVTKETRHLQTLGVYVLPSTKIQAVHYLVQDSWGIPPAVQRFIFGGNRLNYTAKLEDYDIQNVRSALRHPPDLSRSLVFV